MEIQLDEKTLDRTGIPRRYWGAVSDLGLPDVPGSGLYIWGAETGTGKTYTACAVALRFLRTRRPLLAVGTDEVVAYSTPTVRFVAMPDAASTVRDTFGTRQSPSAYRRMLKRCDLLVLDDVGAEQATAWSQEFLYDLIGSRYNYMLPTIVTSNFSRSQLAEHIAYGADRETARRIVSRLAETTVPVEMAGPDRRVRPGGLA